MPWYSSAGNPPVNWVRGNALADVRPFSALRYAAVDDLGTVLAPPYDVVSPPEQEALYRRDPHNVIRLELARGGADGSPGGTYALAAETLRRWRQANVLGHDARPAFYPYKERFAGPDGGQVRTGVFATVRLHPWSDRVVLPHEHTRPKPKADRLELLRACRTQVSPIFSLFRDQDGEIRRLLELATRAAPIACGTVPTAGEIARTHSLWRIDGELADRLSAFFASRAIYIADGHHRYETALEYRDERCRASGRDEPAAAWDFVMMLLVPSDDPGLVVLPTHRLMSTDSPVDAAGLLRGWATPFVVEARPLPPGDRPGSAIADELARRGRGAHVFAALGVEPGVVHYLTLRDQPTVWDKPGTWRDLDVGLLQTLIVEPFERSATGLDVSFTRDPDEAVRLVAWGEQRLALLLNPTTVEQILRVADAGHKMPEKSTYFAPKVATGMVMYPLE